MPAYNLYHTDIKLAFISGILPESVTEQIPNSTLHYWKNIDPSSLVYLPGNNENIHEKVDVMRRALNSKRLYNVIRVLVRVNAILNKAIIDGNHTLDKYKEKIVRIVARFEKVIPRENMFHWFNITAHKFAYWNRNLKKCNSSLAGLCRKRHPHQLTEQETKLIKKYLSSDTFSAWPLCSIYGQMMKEKILFCSLSTFYNYAKWLGFTRKFISYKIYKEGIRATKPGQILHADITLSWLADHLRVYIYLVVDNFSRHILAIKASTVYSALITKENIVNGINQYSDLLQEPFQLIVDDGSENKGELDDFIADHSHLIKKLVAQKDITFSNSMIEAINKTLKNNYLKDRQFATIEKLQNFLDAFVIEFNHRPHGSLHYLSPDEAFRGQIPDKKMFSDDIFESKKKRILENQKFDCTKCVSTGENPENSVENQEKA